MGLLVGDRNRDVARVMTCLTVTPESVEEAIQENVDLIITHHPVPFRPLKRVTTDNVTGEMLLQLMENKVSVYSPHTSFDSAADGINQHLALRLGITDPKPLQPFDDDPDGLGAGRFGALENASTLESLVNVTKDALALSGLYVVGQPTQSVAKIAVACGSAGQFLAQAKRNGCDCLVTGETNFHTCLEAKASGIALILPGHYASERFALEILATKLITEFAGCHIWASKKESDPLIWL